MKKQLKILERCSSWNDAYEIQKSAVRDFYLRGERILEGSISLRPFDEGLLKMEKNLFSILFISVIKNLPVEKNLIPFYASAVHCLRALVTGCDNILDDEYKEILPFRLESRGRVMKSVFVIMTADRILSDLALEKYREGIISYENALKLSSAVIKVLSASGIEEDEEENISSSEYPSPQIMLENYLYRKTGTLFEAPVNLLVEMGEIDKESVGNILKMLSFFGIGCQLLDEIRDFREDFYAGGYNMISSLMNHGKYSTAKDEIAAYLDGNSLNSKNTEKACRNAKKECFSLASEYFIKAGKLLPEAVPDLSYRQIYALADYIKILILKDEDINGELFK